MPPHTRPPRKRGLWFVLTAAIVVLALPFAFYFVPPVLAALTPPEPTPVALIPPFQQAPQALAGLKAVGKLSADAPVPSPDILKKELDAALKISGSSRVRAVVLNAEDGTELYNSDGQEPSVPASNMKLLTALTVLTSMKPYERLATTVVRGKDPNSIVLVGGGDTLLGSGKSNPDGVLGRAGIQTLAEQTVSALADAGVKGEVKVALDDTLFQGDTVSAAWHPGDVAAGEATGVYPIAIDSAWGVENKRDRPKDAALSAAQTFRAALNVAGKDAGISAGGDVTRASGSSGGQLARVESATVSEQVRYMLEESDNMLAEVLGRLAAKAQGNVPSFAGATQAVRASLAELDIDTKSVVIADVSGLALGNRIPAAVLATVVRNFVTTDAPPLTQILPALPVTGQSGTLGDRGAGTDAVGRVHAKTGTLNATSALSGYVVTADSRVLVFSLIYNGLDGNLAEAESGLDRAAAVLAGCGCR